MTVAFQPARNFIYKYNLSGALIEETYPSGRVVKNTLDADGDLALVQSKRNANFGFVKYAQGFTYNSAGAVEKLHLGNGRWETAVYNSRLQVTQIGLGLTDADQNLIKLEFGYNTTGLTDNNGSMRSQKITVPNVGINNGFTAAQTYTYDNLNRLQSATENINAQTTASWKQTFTYDRFGNRRFDTANGNTTTLLSGCPVAVCNPSANPQTNKLNGTSYDAAGNTTLNASNQSYVYDGENKMVQAKEAGNVLIGQYWYDGDGKRIKKYVPSTGETTVFVYDAVGKLVAEYSTLVAAPADAKVSYLTSDHLGSPRVITNQFGQVTSRRDFMPFGEEISSPQRSSTAGYVPDNTRQKFTGYERDNESDLDFAQARYYNKNHGRFSSSDEPFADQFPYNPQSWNLYTYVLNNPLNLTDPSGYGHVTNDGEYVGDYDGEYHPDLGFWVAEGAYWDNGSSKAPLEIDPPEWDEAHPVCNPRGSTNCEWQSGPPYREAGIPIGPIIKNSIKPLKKSLPALRRGLSKNWKSLKNLIEGKKPSGFKTVDDVINAATSAEKRTLKGGKIQKELKGDINQIIEDLADEAGATIQTVGNQKFFISGDVRVGIHASRSGTTLDINKAGTIYKIRVTP